MIAPITETIVFPPNTITRIICVKIIDDLADETDENWKLLADFWRGLDSVGIDMYRSLAADGQELSRDQEKLTTILQQTADRYASQIDNTLFEIEMSVVYYEKNAQKLVYSSHCV